MNDRQKLEAAIAALEAQRDLVGDAVTDAALAPMRERLDGIQEHTQTLKQVTVLFMDVVGSTALSRCLDPEDVHTLIDGALRRLTAIVNGHEGRVLQYAGDSLLAVFGAREAREDDPERAVRCGLAIVREGQQIGAEVRAASRDGDFDVRVGIHTGSVLLGGGVDDASTIRGIAVNIAARMEQTAPAGGVRISHETHHHVRGKFDMTDEAPIAVKGFAEPMRSHLVLRATPRCFGTVGRGIEGVATSMVGREAELAKLIEAFETARDESSLMLVTVSGDPGLGKTRLMLEFEGWLERNHAGAIRLHGRSQPYSNSVPYGLVRDLLAQHFEILESDSQSIAQTKLARGLAAKLREDGSEQAAPVGRLIGFDYGANANIIDIEGDGRQMRDRAFSDMSQYLRLLNKDNGAPIVLLLDDLHWADDGSLDFINHVSIACNDVPILLLCLTRPALFERRPMWCSGRDNHQRVDLAPLSRRSSRDLTEALLARLGPVPAALRDLVTSSAEGNPYFVEELIGMMIDDGVIVAEGERWHVNAERLLQVRVPSTLAGVLQARLDALPPQELATLQHASVIGQVFWDEALQRMAPVAPDILDGLMRRNLALGRDTSTFEGTREYVFKHHLLHKVTYDGVLKRYRRELHLMTAKWLLSRGGQRTREFRELIAAHYESGGDIENAAAHYRDAADSARKTYALRAACASWDRALALMSDSLEKFDLMVKRLNTLFDLGDKVEIDKELRELADLADALDNDERRAIARSLVVTQAAESQDLAATVSVAESALALAERSGSILAALRTHSQLGFAMFAAGEFDKAFEHAERALALALTTDSWSARLPPLNLHAAIANRRGDYLSARKHLQEAAQLAEASDDIGWKASLGCHRATNELDLGQLDVAVDILTAVFRSAEVLSAPDYEYLAAAHLAHAEHTRGRLGDALQWIRRAHAIHVERNSDHMRAVLLEVEGNIRADLGEPALAASCLFASAELHRSLGDACAALEPIAGLARLALGEGNLQLASTYISDLVTHFESEAPNSAMRDELRCRLTCYQVLSVLSDDRATFFLTAAHAELTRRASLLNGIDMASYLESVPTNRAICEAWAHRFGDVQAVDV